MLTNIGIQALKKQAKPYKRSDGGGLYLLINPNGSKIWRFGYRFEGRQKLSHLALQWTILTLVRSQETRFAEWSEFEYLDGPEPLWRIGLKRMKMRSEHLVPLPRQALILLDEICELNVYRKAGNMQHGRLLFPVAGARTMTISENRMLDIMYRIGLRGKATVHGFRGLASTVLNESGRFQPDWIEHQLAHQPRGVRAAYNAAQYLAHRRPMMQWWADYLDEMEAKGEELAISANRATSICGVSIGDKEPLLDRSLARSSIEGRSSTAAGTSRARSSDITSNVKGRYDQGRY